MDKGQLVSDEIVNSILVSAIRSPQCSRGIIFDGYPRNAEQAENLNTLLAGEGRKLDNVINLQVDEEKLYERIEGRRVHLPSGRSYHVKFNPPKVEGVDDVTGEPLVHRNDDKREVMQGRIEIYNKKTAPVIDYYSQHGLVTKLDAMQSIDTIYNRIKDVLL
jgi:adenylate kinase